MSIFLRSAFVLFVFVQVGTAHADNIEKQCGDRLELIDKSEERKVKDLVSYLQRNGIDTSSGGNFLKLKSGIVPSPQSGNPIVGVSVDRDFANRREHAQGDDAWVFGRIAGKVMIGGKMMYTSGSFALSTNLRSLASTWQEAKTSLMLIGPNCQRHLNTFGAVPSTMFSYLITASQLKKSPQAVKGFFQRFSPLVRHHWSN